MSLLPAGFDREKSEAMPPNESAQVDSSLDVDFLDPAVRADPYPAFARLREQDPVHQSKNGTWIITRYAEVDALNRDRRLGRDLRQWAKYDLLRPYVAESALEASLQQWMLSMDPPDHTRLRNVTAHAFSPRALQSLRETVESIAHRLLEDVEEKEEFDYVGSYALPLCVQVIAEVLSFPQEDYAQLKSWSQRLSVVLEPAISREQRNSAVRAAAEMTGYVQELVREHRRRPQEDLLTYLIAGADEGTKISESEVVANVISLFVTGVTNTIIANGLFHLLTNPDQFDRLRAEPSLIQRAVEELLRYDARGINARIALEDVEVGGKQIKEGQLVFCMLGAANRDPEVFPEPDMLDLGRHPNPHVTFGGGIHHCLGAGLTRMEAQVTFDRLARRWSSIDFGEEALQWRDFVAIRSVETLPVTVKH